MRTSDGEPRYSWSASQCSYITPLWGMDNPSTSEVTEGFGLMFYNARWYDPYLGRFAQADTIVTGGVQGLDRYAYVNNAPTRFTDPSGHKCIPEDECAGYSPSGNLLSDTPWSPPLLTFTTEGNRQWTDQEKEILNAGAWDVARAIAREMNAQCTLADRKMGDCNFINPQEAFYSLYGGPVNVVRKAGTCAEVIGYIFPGCGGWGFSNTKNEIWIFDNATPSIINNYPRLIVHELGHSFDKITAMSSDMPDDTKNRNGFFGPASSWQLSTDMADTEVYADMFVGWVYGRWQTDRRTGDLTDPARAKANFMALTASYIDVSLGR